VKPYIQTPLLQSWWGEASGRVGMDVQCKSIEIWYNESFLCNEYYANKNEKTLCCKEKKRKNQGLRNDLKSESFLRTYASS
jgi:hypothetical protein